MRRLVTLDHLSWHEKMYAQISCLISWSTLIYEKEHQYYHWQYGSHVSHEHTHELYHPQHGEMEDLQTLDHFT